MATSEERQGSRDAGRVLAEELATLQRSFLLAQVEGVASLAEVAREFIQRTTEEEPVSGAHTWADVVRGAPGPLLDAGLAASSRLSEVPQRMAETLRAEYGTEPARTERGTHERTAPLRATDHPEQRIVSAARAHLRSVPGGGALLTSLEENVSLRTGFSAETVRPVLLRHFISNGTVVWDRRGSESADAEDPALARMERLLAERGYSDLRREVTLESFSGSTQTAALVAYREGLPAVLGYLTDRNGVEDLRVREAARVQAALLSPSAARYVWVSDGTHDFFYDSQQDRALESLPALEGGA